MSHSDFDKRMKKYEKCHSLSLTPRCPVIIRLDGKAFHTYTRALKDKTKLDKIVFEVK